MGATLHIKPSIETDLECHRESEFVDSAQFHILAAVGILRSLWYLGIKACHGRLGARLSPHFFN